MNAASTVGDVYPSLIYDDAPAAVDWLCKAFNFTRRLVVPGPNDRIEHSELSLGSAVIMVSSPKPDAGRVSPRGLPGVPQALSIRVDDPDAHYKKAKASGAVILRELRDEHGARGYMAKDPEGHIWYFGNPLLGPVRALHKKLTTGKGAGDMSFGGQESAEMWRLLGSLELLPVRLKIELGDMVLDLITKPSIERLRPALTWALARLGARVPLYGPLNTLVPVQTASGWLTRLLGQDDEDAMQKLAIMQLARRTDDRYRDLPDSLRERVLTWLKSHSAPRHFLQLVHEGGRLDSEEQGLVFGEALPKGLRLA